MTEEFLFRKFISKIKARFKYQNKNWLAIICGETGSGKSYSAISLGGMLGTVHIVFTSLEFMQLINNTNKISKGDIIIFDEAGVGMSAREWQSVNNKLLGSILQTFRNMNVGVIFTTPNLSFIDVQARKLFHNYFETAYIDYEKEEAFLKVYDIQVNSRLDKIYYKRPRIIDETGRVFTVCHIGVPKANQKLLEYYEQRKSAYTKQLNANALAELSGGKVENKPKEVDIKSLAKEVIKRKSDFVREYHSRKFVDLSLLINHFGLSIGNAKNLKKEVENRVLCRGRGG